MLVGRAARAMPRERRFLTPEELRRDFDRIATLQLEGSHPALGHYSWIVNRLPPGPASALDLGCGSGGLTRLLAERCGDALGVDLSPGMLAAARAATPAGTNARYVAGDLRDTPGSGETFDVVTAVAALHHLPIASALQLAAARVRPGGVLIVVDLYQSPELPGALRSVARWGLDTVDSLVFRRRMPDPRLHAAWTEHGDWERLPTRQEVRSAASELPGAELAFRLRWRWTLAWRRPP